MNPPFLSPIERLQHWAEVQPDKPAFIFLEQGEVETSRLTFAELERRVREVAAHLQAVSQAGERALLIYPTGLDFVTAMYGCLYAGVVPIPTNPPGMNRSARRLEAIAQDAQADLVLSTPEFIRAFGQRDEQLTRLQAIRWVDHSTIPSNPKAQPALVEQNPERLAFIQYTSGSTNIPKGVMVSYRNLSYNRYAILEARTPELAEDSVIVIWVPLFHDMGLLVGVFQGVFDGSTTVMMTPMAFIQKPLRWLQAINKYRGTFSGGPNFAFDICAAKITTEECQGLDLSCWRMAFNSAEPVRLDTLENFSRKFAPCGFNPLALQPYYGLAEATLVLTGFGGWREPVALPLDREALECGRAEVGDPQDAQATRMLVSCGKPLVDIQIAIVNPLTRQRCAPGEIGEIWAAGGNIAEGYWNLPQDTQETFRARIPGDPSGPYLRTGDLGFLHDGELYVTGRQKDLIIIRGRNYYPQDVEFTAQKCHPLIRPGSGAAFPVVVAGGEQLVLVQEARPMPEDFDWGSVIKALRVEIAREHGIRAWAVQLIPPSSIPKTSSGKIMRSEARRMFLANEFDVLAEWRAPLGQVGQEITRRRAVSQRGG